MRLLRKILLGFAATLLSAGAAYAQVGAFTGTMPSAPTVTTMHSSDLSPVVSTGAAQALQGYAPIGAVSGQTTYQSQVPLTGFTITAPNPQTASFLFLNPAGTLATGTLTMPAAPNDGGSFCVMSTQTQTALTVSANTGQTVAGTAVTALTAYVPACWRYWAITATWSRLGS